MTVYVDDMRARFGRMIMCHMIADTDDELHAMADKIGVARKWHQAPPQHNSHYDIALSMRALAICHGAVPITMREWAAMVSVRRMTGKMPRPDEALELRRKLFEGLACQLRESEGATPSQRTLATRAAEYAHQWQSGPTD